MTHAPAALAPDGAATRYSRVAIALHWTIAAFIIANLALGLVMEDQKPPAFRLFLVRTHFSLGVTVFVLTLARLAWRLTHRPPPLPAHYPAWERLAAHAAHMALYALMLVMPVIGWMILSAHLIRPTLIWWTFVLPGFAPVVNLPEGPAKTQLHDQFVLLHSIGGWTMIALLALHVAAALKHQLLDGDPELQRMGVGLLRPRRARPADTPDPAATQVP